MRSKALVWFPKLSWIAFCATLVLIPFRLRLNLLARPQPPIWADYTDFLLFASDLGLILTLSFWCADLYIRPRRIESGPAFLALPLVGLGLVALLTSFTAVDPALSIYHTIRLALLFLFYIYVINNVPSLRQLVLPLGLMAGIQATAAIAQALTQHSVGLQVLGEYELDPAWPGVSVVWTETVRSLRGYGLSDHPNILGGCLAFALVLLAASYISEERRRLPFILPTVIAGGAVALLVTYSRSAWLGAAAGMALLGFYVVRKDRKQLRRSLILAAVVLAALAPFVWANVDLLGVRLGAGGSFEELPAEIGSLGERRVLIDAANQVFSKHALLGVGVGGSPLAFKEEFPEFAVNYQPAHLAILSAAVETGLLGAVFYAILVFAPWLALFLARGLKWNLNLAGASALLLALTLVGLFDYYTWLLAPGRLWQYLAWGLWARFYSDAKLNKSR
ncbi:MAG: O-antigen ligase family protein [Anaerolineales bacterium]